MKTLFSYLKIGNRNKNLLFKRNFNFYFQFLIYLLVNLVLKLTIVFAPLAIIASENLVTEGNKKRHVTTDLLFKDIEKKDKYKKLLMLYISKVLVLLVGLSIIGFLGYTLITAAILLDEMTRLSFYLFTILVSVLILILALYFLINAYFKFDFAIFVQNKNNDLEASEAFKTSELLLDKELKIFLSFIHFLYFLIVFAIGYLVVFIVNTYSTDLLTTILLLTFLGIISIFIILRLTMTLMQSKNLYYHFVLTKDVKNTYQISTEEEIERDKASALIALFEAEVDKS